MGVTGLIRRCKHILNRLYFQVLFHLNIPVPRGVGCGSHVRANFLSLAPGPVMAGNDVLRLPVWSYIT